MISRRGIIGVLSGLIAAPTIVKATSLMPVNSALAPGVSMRMVTDYVAGADVHTGGFDVLFGHLNVRPEWMVVMRDLSAANNLLTIDQITRESVKLFKNNNLFLKNIDQQYDEQFAVEGARIGDTLRIRLPNDYVMVDRPITFIPRTPDPAPQPTLNAPAAVALGAAAVVAANPVVSRRFWSNSNSQERKEDGSQPRDPSSPATQRNNHGEVA